MIADVSLVRKVTVVSSKEIVGQLLPKSLVSICHLLSQKLSVMNLISELCEIQGITFSVFWLIKMTAKKKP